MFILQDHASITILCNASFNYIIFKMRRYILFFKEKKNRHKLIIFLIYALHFLSLVLLDNENIIIFYLMSFLYIHFFNEYRKK